MQLSRSKESLRKDNSSDVVYEMLPGRKNGGQYSEPGRSSAMAERHKPVTEDISAQQVWTVLSRCARTLGLLAEDSIAGSGLGLTDFMVLESLLHKGPLTITQIQEKVLLASGSMTAAIDRLERQGWLERKASAGDRRARVLELTREGRAVIGAAFERHARDLESAMEVLSAEERRELYELARRLGLWVAEKRQAKRVEEQGNRSER